MKTFKKIILLLSVVMLPGLIFSQSNPLDEMIAKYKDKEGFYYLELKTDMFNKHKDEENKVSQQKRVINILMLSYEEGQNTSYKAKTIYKEFSREIDKDNYIGLIEVKSSGDNVEILVKEIKDIITEVIILIKEEKEAAMIAITGNFDLKDLAKFSELKKCKGLEILGKICEE